MRLTLIRHGPTEWNASRRFQGRTDLPLSARGCAQAGAIARSVHGERFDRIYTSDLARAVQTARIVGESRRSELVVDERLREFDFGEWEGLTWNEIVAANPHLAGHWSSAAKLYAPQGGETFGDVTERVRAFLSDLAQQPLEAAAIVTHAGPLHAIFAVLRLHENGKPEDSSLRFTPGGITRITVQGDRAELIAVNDLRHLDAAE